MTTAERQTRNFWKKVDKSPHPKGCWMWTAAKHEKGYGWFGYRGRMDKAHRVSHIINKGEIPDGLHVLHRCDNPSCVNPDHLFTGTNQDNVTDKEAKGRGNQASGENNKGGGKLTWVMIRQIRALRVAGLSQQAIADQFGVSQPMIGLIVRNVRWKEVEHIATSRSV